MAGRPADSAQRVTVTGPSGPDLSCHSREPVVEKVVMPACVAMCTCVHLQGALGIHLTWNSHNCRYRRGVVLSCPNYLPPWSQAPRSRKGTRPSCHGDTGLSLHTRASLANGSLGSMSQTQAEAHSKGAPSPGLLTGQEEGKRM